MTLTTTVYGLSLSTSWPFVQPVWGSVFESLGTGRAPGTVYGIYFNPCAFGVSVGFRNFEEA